MSEHNSTAVPTTIDQLLDLLDQLVDMNLPGKALAVALVHLSTSVRRQDLTTRLAAAQVANRLGVQRNTVTSAYAALAARGVIRRRSLGVKRVSETTWALSGGPTRTDKEFEGSSQAIVGFTRAGQGARVNNQEQPLPVQSATPSPQPLQESGGDLQFVTSWMSGLEKQQRLVFIMLVALGREALNRQQRQMMDDLQASMPDSQWARAMTASKSVPMITGALNTTPVPIRTNPERRISTQSSPKAGQGRALPPPTRSPMDDEAPAPQQESNDNDTELAVALKVRKAMNEGRISQATAVELLWSATKGELSNIGARDPIRVGMSLVVKGRWTRPRSLPDSYVSRATALLFAH